MKAGAKPKAARNDQNGLYLRKAEPCGQEKHSEKGNRRRLAAVLMRRGRQPHCSRSPLPYCRSQLQPPTVALHNALRKR